MSVENFHGAVQPWMDTIDGMVTRAGTPTVLGLLLSLPTAERLQKSLYTQPSFSHPTEFR